MSRLISLMTLKGGLGKTTTIYNLAEFLASKGKKICLMDLDYQCNLTQTYGIYDNENTVGDIFTNSDYEVTFRTVKKNIDLLAGFMTLDEVGETLQTKANKEFILYMWLSDNSERLNFDQYDYVFIDCHPDFSTITKNAVAVSHHILSLVDPSEYGFSAKDTIQLRLDKFKSEAIDLRSRESLVTAKLHYIANDIKHNTRSSKELIQVVENDPEFISVIPNKELFNKTTMKKIPLSEMKDIAIYRTGNEEFFDIVFKEYNKIEKVISV